MSLLDATKVHHPGLEQCCNFCLGLRRRVRQANKMISKAQEETDHDLKEGLLLGAMVILRTVQDLVRRDCTTKKHHRLDYRRPDVDDVPRTHTPDRRAALRLLNAKKNQPIGWITKYIRHAVGHLSTYAEVPGISFHKMTYSMKTGESKHESLGSDVRIEIERVEELGNGPSDSQMEEMKKFVRDNEHRLQKVAEASAEYVSEVLDAYCRR